jgi:SEL1 protein
MFFVVLVNARGAIVFFILVVLSKEFSKFQVRFIDSLPEIYPVVEEWVEDVLLDEGNATILTLFACLVTVLYLRERQRRQVAAANPQQPDGGAPM